MFITYYATDKQYCPIFRKTQPSPNDDAEIELEMVFFEGMYDFLVFGNKKNKWRTTIGHCKSVQLQASVKLQASAA